MGYEAIKNKIKNVKRVHNRERAKEMKQTCLSSDSIIASFCLICAKRYSRLLITGEKSDDGVGEEQREGEGETESVDVIDGDEGACIVASGIVVSKGTRGKSSGLGKVKTDELKPLEPTCRYINGDGYPLSFRPHVL
jgi:hypothetical protein